MKRVTRLVVACLTIAEAVALPATFAAAQAPATPFNLVKPFELTKVTDNVYSFRFALHRNMVVVTNDGVVVTDPINSTASRHMVDEIRRVTDKPVKLVIYSHNHWDHIAGARIFRDQGAKILQHELAAQSTRPNPDVLPADETFKGDKNIVTVGDQTIELIYLGPSHGSGMTVMRLPKERVLHAVDVIVPGRIAVRGMPDFFPQDWIKALRKIEALDFDIIVPGHGPASAPKSAATAQREYVEDLTKAVAEATRTAGPFAFDKIIDLVKAELRPKYGQWAEFDNWMPLNVDRIMYEQRIGW